MKRPDPNESWITNRIKKHIVILSNLVKLVCVQSNSYYRLHDRNEHHQNTMDSALDYASTLDNSECNHTLRHFSFSGSPKINAFEYNSSFAFFGDNQKQQLFEIEHLLYA